MVPLLPLLLLLPPAPLIASPPPQLSQSAGKYVARYLSAEGGGELSGRLSWLGPQLNMQLNATLAADLNENDTLTMTVDAWANGGWKRVGRHQFRYGVACRTALRYAARSPAAAALLDRLNATTTDTAACLVKKGDYSVTVPVDQLTDLMREMYPVFFYGRFKMQYVYRRAGNETARFNYVKEIIRN